ncbi:MAG: septation protein SepH [Actinomycetes bacterium]
MTELIITGRSEDGEYLALTNAQGEAFTLSLAEVEEELMSETPTPTPKLVAISNYYDQQDEVVVTVKDIQARLRAGQTMADISAQTEWSVEKIEKFSGPILQERAYVISQAMKSPLRREAQSPTLATAAHSQLLPRGVVSDDIEWNTARNEDGTWKIRLSYPIKDGTDSATWVFDLSKQMLTPTDDGAKWISGDEPQSRAKVPTHGNVYNNQPAPRLVAVREEEFTETIRISTTPVAPKVVQPTLIDDATSELPADAKKDGVTKRIRIPSWDNIMFGKNDDK